MVATAHPTYSPTVREASLGFSLDGSAIITTFLMGPSGVEVTPRPTVVTMPLDDFKIWLDETVRWREEVQRRFGYGLANPAKPLRYRQDERSEDTREVLIGAAGAVDFRVNIAHGTHVVELRPRAALALSFEEFAWFVALHQSLVTAHKQRS